MAETFVSDYTRPYLLWRLKVCKRGADAMNVSQTLLAMSFYFCRRRCFGQLGRKWCPGVKPSLKFKRLRTSSNLSRPSGDAPVLVVTTQFAKSRCSPIKVTSFNEHVLSFLREARVPVDEVVGFVFSQTTIWLCFAPSACRN